MDSTESTCSQGLYGIHVETPGTGICFLCGTKYGSARRVTPRGGPESYLNQPDHLEPDDGDYHDYPDQITGNPFLREYNR